MKNAVAFLSIGLMKLIALLPLSMIQGLGSAFGQFLLLINASSVKNTRTNIQTCFPELSKSEQEQMVKESTINLGKTAMEMSMAWLWPVKKIQTLFTQVEGLEHLENALERKQGVILMAPHLGNWELLTHFFKPYLTMTAMYKPAKIKAMDNFMYETRKRVGIDLAPANNNGVKMLFKTLLKKGVAGVLPDQEPALNSGVFADFYNRPALTGRLISDLAKKTPAALLTCFAMRLDDGTFKVVIRQANEQIRCGDPELAAKALNESIEACIQECPSQYQWSYKRFRRQPEGLHSPYRKIKKQKAA